MVRGWVMFKKLLRKRPKQKSAKMDKIFLIGDSTENSMSENLRNVLQSNSITSNWEHFAFVLHALMLEVGFEEGAILKKSEKSVQFAYQNSECHLNLHKIGPVTSIIGNFHGQPSQSFVWTKTQTPSKFQDLKNISNVFKDKIALPLLRSQDKGTFLI